MTQPGTKTAVLYARVSDRKQASADVSIPSQVEAGVRKAAELGAAVVRSFVDGGRSAFKESNRPTFDDAVEFCVVTEVDYLITWSSSRFARNRFEAMTRKRELTAGGVRLIYTSADIDLETDEGWLLDSMFEVMDEAKSRGTSKDTTRSMVRNAKCGFFCGGVAPYGFKVVPDLVQPKRRRLVPNENESPWVIEMFDRRANGFGATQISEALNSLGAVRRDGKKWDKTSVLYILKNPMVIGRTIYGRKARGGRIKDPSAWVVVDAYPPLIPVEHWERVQAIIAASSPQQTGDAGSSRSTHAFTGLMRCGLCGQAMQIETARGRSKQYAYYNCQRSLKHKDCESRRIRADVLDPWMSEIIVDQVITPENMRVVADAIEAEAVAYVAERGKKRSELTKRLSSVQLRNKRLLDVLEVQGRDAPDLADIAPRLRDNSAIMKALEAEIAALETVPSRRVHMDDASLVDLAEFLRGELLDTENAKTSRSFYSRFVKSITVQADTVEIRYDPTRLVAQPISVHSAANWLPELDSNQ